MSCIARGPNISIGQLEWECRTHGNTLDQTTMICLVSGTVASKPPRQNRKIRLLTCSTPQCRVRTFTGRKANARCPACNAIAGVTQQDDDS